jgi:ubiquinone/menaquinone biosynthesis C-methylase UbiE
MRFKDIFATSDQSNSLGNKFRIKRMAFFKEKVDSLKKPVKILDIGGLESFWINSGFADNPDYHITLLNLHKEEVHFSNFNSMVGNAWDLSDIPDGAFDVVFSNSVIEHLYTRENQLKMAQEVRRVGRFYYIQTPNKHFPVEPHYVLPLFQYFPDSLKFFILTKTKLSRLHRWDPAYAKQYIEEIRLLTEKEMKELFPGSGIYKEYFGGLVKSYCAHNFK